MVEFAAEAFDSPEVLAMSRAYYTELRERFPNGFVPDEHFSAHPEDFLGPGGLFLVGRAEGLAIGCGGLRSVDVDAAEIKHMWIDPKWRGQGIGRVLLDALVSAAREMGCERVLLDTSEYLPEAISLYQKAGFLEIASYNDNPYAQHWFEKRLA